MYDAPLPPDPTGLTSSPSTGDEVRPVCGRCARNGTFCTRVNPQTLITHHVPTSVPPGPSGPFIPASPREALLQPGIAPLFHRYISVIASWYDLGDPARHFATSVPRLALDEPLLFSGVIAVAGMHHGKTTAGKPALAIARAYHTESVGRLIRLDETSRLLENGVALATVCLLRSYEILDGKLLVTVSLNTQREQRRRWISGS